MRWFLLALPLAITALASACCASKTDPKPEANSAVPIPSSHGSVAPLSPSSSVGDSLAFSRYHNPRFGFAVDYPSHFKASTPPDNGDGQEWTWNGASMIASGSLNVSDETLDSLFEKERRRPGVTGAFKKPGYFVVTGKQDGKIFYEKQFVSQEQILTLLYTYPEAMKTPFDPIVTRGASSFRQLKHEP